MDKHDASRIALRMSGARGVRMTPEQAEDLAELIRVILASPLADMPFEVVNATLDVVKGEHDEVTPRILIRACRERAVIPKRSALPGPEDESGPALRPVYFPDRPSGRETYPLAVPNARERERMRVYYASAVMPACVVSRPDLGIRPDHVARANVARQRAVEQLESGLAKVRDRGTYLEPGEREIAREAEHRLEALRSALAPEPTMTPARRFFTASLVRLGLQMTRENALRCSGCGSRPLTEVDLRGAIAALMEASDRGATTGHVYCEACRTGRPAAPAPEPWLDPEVGLPPEELERLIALEKGES